MEEHSHLDVPRLVHEATQTFLDLKNALHAMCDSVDVRAAFASYAAHKIRSSSSETAARGLPVPAALEFAAWHLFPFFSNGTDKNPHRIDEFITLLEELEDAHVRLSFLEGLSTSDEPNRIESHVETFSSIVRGSAYPQQIERRLRACFSSIEKDLETITGTNPVRIAALIRELVLQTEDNLNKMGSTIQETFAKYEIQSKLANPDDTILKALHAKMEVALEALAGDWVPCWKQISFRTNANSADWQALREHIGLTVSSRAEVTRLVDAQDRPIFFLSETQAFCVTGTQALDAIFVRFDSLARSNPNLRDRYAHGIAEWMERRIEEFCLRLFPAAVVIRSAVYPDPDHPRGETEADCIVLWGPFLLIFEAKGSRVDNAAVRGESQKLRKLIGKNIQDAFIQAQRVIRVLERDGHVVFREKDGERTLRATREQIQQILPISVTLQHLFGIPTQLAAAQKLGLFKGNAYPWSVCIDDLETITRFVGWPDAFIHYIHRRTAHQAVDVSLDGDELDIFAHYLDNRLHPSIYESRPEIAAHQGDKSIFFDGGEERFGKIYASEWYGERTSSDEIGLKLPPLVQEILTELRNGNSDDARWIAFSLLGLSDTTLRSLEKALTNLKKTETESGRILRITHKDGDVVINLMVHGGLNSRRFMENLLVRTRIEHYRHKPRASVTIGVDRRSSRAFQHVLWLEGDLGIEPAMEKILLEDQQRPKKSVELDSKKKP